MIARTYVASLTILTDNPEGLSDSQAKVTGAGFLRDLTILVRRGLAQTDTNGITTITERGRSELADYRRRNPIEVRGGSQTSLP